MVVILILFVGGVTNMQRVTDETKIRDAKKSSQGREEGRVKAGETMQKKRKKAEDARRRCEERREPIESIEIEMSA